MAIAVSCPHCQRAFRAPDSTAGKRVKCPACAGVITVPAAGPDAEPPAESGKAAGPDKSPPPARAASSPRRTAPVRIPDDAEPRRRTTTPPAPAMAKSRAFPVLLVSLIGGGAGLVLLIVILVIAFSGPSGNPSDRGGLNPPPVGGQAAGKKPPPPPTDDLAITLPPLKDGEVKSTHRLTADDPRLPGQDAACKVFLVPLEQGHLYNIRPDTTAFSAAARIETRKGDKDSNLGGRRFDPRAGYYYRPRESGLHRILVISTDFRLGEFTLTVRDTAYPEPVAPKPLAEVALPQPTVTGTDLSPKEVPLAKLLTTVGVRLLNKAVVQAVWKKPGESVFLLEEEGVLREILVPEFKEVRRLDLKQKCGALAMSAEGLVLAVTAVQEVWVVSPASLQVTKRISARGVGTVLASPASSWAYAGCYDTRAYRTIRGEAILALDLQQGRCVGAFDLTSFKPALSQNGQTLLVVEGVTRGISCYRASGPLLLWESTNPTRFDQVAEFAISPDGRRVFRDRVLYNTNDLKFATKPLDVGQGASPDRVAAFAPARDVLFVSSPEFPLMLFSTQGEARNKYQGEAPGAAGQPIVRQILPFPGDDRILLLCERDLLLAIPGKEKG